MPLLPSIGQPASPSLWFECGAGRAVLDSEHALLAQALAERPAQPWLWLAPASAPWQQASRGLYLRHCGGGWSGPLHCRLPLPLASESIGVVVLQHVLRPGASGGALLAECARVLAPGGRLWLFALNPLAPYRWRWRGAGLRACEPLTWRRRLREAGLDPQPVSRGVGPSWQVRSNDRQQDGPGLRAAYAIAAEKRVMPLTPRRLPGALRLPEGIPAA